MRTTRSILPLLAIATCAGVPPCLAGGLKRSQDEEERICREKAGLLDPQELVEPEFKLAAMAAGMSQAEIIAAYKACRPTDVLDAFGFNIESTPPTPSAFDEFCDKLGKVTEATKKVAEQVQGLKKAYTRAEIVTELARRTALMTREGETWRERQERVKQQRRTRRGL